MKIDMKKYADNFKKTLKKNKVKIKDIKSLESYISNNLNISSPEYNAINLIYKIELLKIEIEKIEEHFSSLNCTYENIIKRKEDIHTIKNNIKILRCKLHEDLFFAPEYIADSLIKKIGGCFWIITPFSNGRSFCLRHITEDDFEINIRSRNKSNELIFKYYSKESKVPLKNILMEIIYACLANNMNGLKINYGI